MHQAAACCAAKCCTAALAEQQREASANSDVGRKVLLVQGACSTILDLLAPSLSIG